MDRPKLKLKEQPADTGESMAWLQGHRFAPPKPPSVLERLAGAFKRILPVFLFLAVSAAAFLMVPFQRWDDYAAWTQLKDDFAQLETQSESLPSLQRALATANEAGILWGEPSGPCPEKWYQRAQQRKYEASYGIVQTLALGIVKHGKTDRGLSELENLRRRTGVGILPPLPDTQNLVTPCSACKKGALSNKCAECGGQKTCKRCSGKGTVAYPNPESRPHLTASLAGTHLPAKRLGNDTPVQRKCTVCQGSGKCLACGGIGSRSSTCPTCRGQAKLIDLPSIPKLYQDSLTRTLVLVNNEMEIRKFVHGLAKAQRYLLMKGASTGRTIMSAANIDISFDSNEKETGAALEPGKADAPLFGEKASAPIITQDPTEASLQKACETLLQTPLSIPDLTTLASVARTATNSPALRSRAMAAFALAHLLQGNTNNFARATQILESTFPGEPSLITVTADDYICVCDSCQGKGSKVTPCPYCMGPNKCPSCNGTGKKAAGDGFVPCEACKNRGVCTTCKGQRQLTIGCPACKSSGQLLSVKDPVRENYGSLLSNMVAICSENVLFAEQFALAQAEKNGPARIGLLQSITNHFPSRAESPQVIALLDAALKECALATNACEGASAPNGSPTGTSGNQGQPTATSGKGAQGKKPNLMALGACILGGIALLSLAFKRMARRPRSRKLNSSLPGMRNINIDAFTDPLTLTADDSRMQSGNRQKDNP